MTRLTDLLLRPRRLVVVVWFILALAGGWAASGLSGALSQSFDAPGRPAFEANKEIVERYRSGGVVAPIVAVVDGVDARDPAVARAFERVAAAVPGSRLAAGRAGLPRRPDGNRDRVPPPVARRPTRTPRRWPRRACASDPASTAPRCG